MKYDVEHLMRISLQVLEEARKCSDKGCYVAAFVLYGFVLEAFLLTMCFCYPEEVRKTKKFHDLRKRLKRKRELFLDLSLAQLIEISRELRWLPLEEQVDNTGIVEDWVRFVQEARNLVHPGRWLKRSQYFPELPRILKGIPYKELRKYVNICEETIECVALLLEHKLKTELTKRLGAK